MHTQWFDKWLSWFGATWDGERVKEEKPSLEERINAQIKVMEHNVVAQDGVNNNILGMMSRHERALYKLERRNEQVDAHYVRTMATAFDEKHGAFAEATDNRQVAHMQTVNQMLKSIEEYKDKQIAALQEQIEGLRKEVEATSQHVQRLLARLRAVGEGN